MTDIQATTPNVRIISSIELETLWANVWVRANLDGTSANSYGVSSLTDVGTGQIGVGLNITFTDTNYVATGTAQETTGVFKTIGQTTANLSTTRCDFRVDNGSGVAIDPIQWNLMVLGNIAI